MKERKHWKSTSKCKDNNGHLRLLDSTKMYSKSKCKIKALWDKVKVCQQYTIPKSILKDVLQEKYKLFYKEGLGERNKKIYEKI